MAQLSRGDRRDGEPSRRGVPTGSSELYACMLAPVWWIDDVGQAYGAAKYLNVLVMTAAVFPTYGLARMVVSKPWALFAAAGAGMIPGLYYSSMLVEEPLAYPWAALAAYLIAKALAVRTLGWIGLAGVRLAARSAGARAARRRSCCLRARDARAPGDERARESGIPPLVALGLGRRGHARRRRRDRGQRRDLALLLRVADRDDLLQGPDARARPLGRRRARDRRRRPPHGRRARGARASPGRAVDARAAGRRRDDGSADRRLRLVHGGQGGVHLDRRSRPSSSSAT